MPTEGEGGQKLVKSCLRSLRMPPYKKYSALGIPLFVILDKISRIRAFYAYLTGPFVKGFDLFEPVCKHFEKQTLLSRFIKSDEHPNLKWML